MQINEQRREQRYTLPAHPKGQLLIHVSGVRIPVNSVRDISSNGISLVFSGAVVESGDITIEYRSKGIDLKVKGSVIWEYKETDENGHPQNVLGVKLFGPTMLMAAMQDN